MSFRIEKGLFKFDFFDFYAILGIPVDAKPDEIRKRYLKIAQVLHPDRCKAETAADKQRASQMFSKLVNPAYEQLFKDKGRNEYIIVLGRMGKRLASDPSKVQIQSEAAKQLSQAGGNLDHVYKTSVQKLAAQQYESLEGALDLIGQISELNMVYLMKKDGDVAKKAAGAPSGSTVIKSGVPGTPPPAEEKKAEQPQASVAVEAYCRRAEEYMAKNVIAKAVLELRDALQQEPNNSRCHGLLGMAYLRQNQATMAKIHITKALQLNPQEPNALKGKEILDKYAQKTAANASKSGAPPAKSPPGKTPPGKPDDKQGGGGLFGGIFGGKKK